MIAMHDRPGNDLTAFLVTLTLIVADVARSVTFYRDVIGAVVLREAEPSLLRLGNIWLSINVGGGPTDDKPQVTVSLLTGSITRAFS
jgi:catechol 2,3-dioxygenase-like lactoylglutathione lyase family enzyme